MNLLVIVLLYFGLHTHPVGTARVHGCVVKVAAITVGGPYRADIACKDQQASYLILETTFYDKAKNKPVHDLYISEYR